MVILVTLSALVPAYCLDIVSPLSAHIVRKAVRKDGGKPSPGVPSPKRHSCNSNTYLAIAV